jgi:hypothetical protein
MRRILIDGAEIDVSREGLGEKIDVQTERPGYVREDQLPRRRR